MKANDRRGNNEAVGRNRRCTFPFFPSLVPIIIATEFSSRFSISLPVLYVAKRKTGSSNVARFYPISPDNIRRWPNVGRSCPKLPDISRRSLAALSVVQTTLWSCNICFMHMPRFTYDTTHYQCKRVTQNTADEKHNAFAMGIERGEQLPWCFDTKLARFAEHSKNYASRSSFFLPIVYV